jgi:hypothetical protein
MYYDEEKKKYFAIQKNHQVPSGSKYTASNVLRRNEIKRERNLQKERELSHQKRQPIPRLRKSRILDSWAGWDLARSDGSLGALEGRQAFVNSYLKTFGSNTPGDGWHRSNSRDPLAIGTPAVVVDLSTTNKQTPEPGIHSHRSLSQCLCDADAGRWDITSFAWDPLLRCLYLSAYPGCICAFEEGPSVWSAALNVQDPFRLRLPQSLGDTMWSESMTKPDTVSFQVKLEGFRYLASSGNDSYNRGTWSLSVTPRHSLVAIEVSGPDHDQQFCFLPSYCLDIPRMVPNTHNHSHIEYPTGQDAVFCTAPNPFQSGNDIDDSQTIAFGTDGGVVFAAIGEGIVTEYKCDPLMETYSDVLSLEWLGRDTLVAGLRNSGILLHDRRVGVSVVRLRHSSSVVHLARADESGTKLVACGVPSVMSMYDLRMVREVSSQSPDYFASSMRSEWKVPWLDRKRRKISPQVTNCPRSEPVFNFEYRNKTAIQIGFDVCRAWGLLAAAQDTGSIQLYSLRDGKKVKELFLPTVTSTETDPGAPNPRPTVVKCLKLVDDHTGLRILASCGGIIYQFGILENDDTEKE